MWCCRSDNVTRLTWRYSVLACMASQPQKIPINCKPQTSYVQAGSPNFLKFYSLHALLISNPTFPVTCHRSAVPRSSLHQMHPCDVVTPRCQTPICSYRSFCPITFTAFTPIRLIAPIRLTRQLSSISHSHEDAIFLTIVLYINASIRWQLLGYYT